MHFLIQIRVESGVKIEVKRYWIVLQKSVEKFRNESCVSEMAQKYISIDAELKD